MKVSPKGLFQYLRRQACSSPSRVFVSISVVSTMPRTRLSRHSTKVIVRVSIWTCLILILLFLSVYTVLLVCVDKQLHPPGFDVPYKKIRLLGRVNSKYKYGFMNSIMEDNFPVKKSSHRKVVWNSSVYYHHQEPHPPCRLQTFITVLVTSSPENRDRRMAIRDTWCNHRHFSASQLAWKCIFLIGASQNDEQDSLIREEKAVYNDILLGIYVDSYRNLTLKVIHGISWSADFCPSSYVIKTDDDCFVNIQLVYEFLVHYNSRTQALYAGSLLTDRTQLKVIRGARKKWSVGYEEYSQDYYPPYASGIGYILSADVVKELASESMYIFPISNEDAYVGVVMSQLGITPVNSKRFIISSSGLSVCNFLYVFIVHHVQSDFQVQLLKKAVESRTKCNHSAITTWS